MHNGANVLLNRSRTKGRPFDIDNVYYTAVGENNNTYISCVLNGSKYINPTIKSSKSRIRVCIHIVYS